MSSGHLVGAPEPTYTPKTYRISKAKKGKRVHACDQCDKVFTRAEHLRRHQLNHNEQLRQVCDVPGCSKTFHRSDLLTRHMERYHPHAANASMQFSSDHAPGCSSTQDFVADNTPSESSPPGSFGPQIIVATMENPMISYIEPNTPPMLAMSQPTPSTDVLEMSGSLLPETVPSPTPLGAGLTSGLLSQPLPNHSNLNYHPAVSDSPQVPPAMSHADMASASWRACISPSSQSWLWATGAGTCSGFTIPSGPSEGPSFGQVQHLPTSSPIQSPWPHDRPSQQVPAQALGHPWWIGQCTGERTWNR